MRVILGGMKTCRLMKPLWPANQNYIMSFVSPALYAGLFCTKSRPAKDIFGNVGQNRC